MCKTKSLLHWWSVGGFTRLRSEGDQQATLCEIRSHEEYSIRKFNLCNIVFHLQVVADRSQSNMSMEMGNQSNVSNISNN